MADRGGISLENGRTLSLLFGFALIFRVHQYMFTLHFKTVIATILVWPLFFFLGGGGGVLFYFGCRALVVCGFSCYDVASIHCAVGPPHLALQCF